VFLVNARRIYPLNVIAGDVSYPDTAWIQETLRQWSRALYWIEATSHAMALGGPIMLNMIMLGGLCAIPDFPLQVQDVHAVLGDVFSASKLKKNEEALAKGQDLVTSYDP
jgi:Pyruvate/2-oxoacid:ferredoxin oxidoreductase gamma subunit